MQLLEVAIEPATMTTIIVNVAGELDITSAEQLCEAVGSIEPGFTTVILELRELTLIDSTGIACLIGLHRRLDEAARMLQLRNVCGHPRRVLEMTGLLRSFHLT